MTAVVYDVVGLGNAIVDVISAQDDAFLTKWGINKDAMNLIEEDRADALTEASVNAVETSGGSGANTIAGVASFGGKAAYIGKVADDRLGKVFKEDMEKGGVPFETTPLIDGPATARSIIFVTPDGKRSMNTFLGASVEFAPSDVDRNMVEAGGILYLEGYLFDKEIAKSAFVHAAEIAHAAGRKVSLTLSDSFCVDRHRDSFRQLIRTQVDILFALIVITVVRISIVSRNVLVYVVIVVCVIVARTTRCTATHIQCAARHVSTQSWRCVPSLLLLQ